MWSANTGACVCMMCPFECPSGTRWSNEDCDCVGCSDPKLSGKGCANRYGSPLDIVSGDDNEDDDVFSPEVIGGDDNEDDDDADAIATTSELSLVDFYERQKLNLDINAWTWDRCNKYQKWSFTL